MMPHIPCTRRGCLKPASASHIPPPLRQTDEYPHSCSPYRACTPVKSVSWCSSDEYDVWDADEWDRTPSEPARKLSYQDLLELKAIQRTLPRANQPPDPYTRKPASHYLGKVPIGLLPLSDAGSAPSRYPDVSFGGVKVDESDGHTPRAPTSPPNSPVSSPGVGKKSFVFMPLLESVPKKRNVMYINGEEVDLDEPEPPKQPDPSPKATLPSPDPISLPACSFRAKRPMQSSSSSTKSFAAPHTSPRIPRSPPSWENGFVRATRDNPNPSGMVGLSGWRAAEGRRSPPVGA